MDTVDSHHAERDGYDWDAGWVHGGRLPYEKTPQDAWPCGVLFLSGRYRTRICDLHDVNVAL